jgi:predicted ATPase
VYRTVRTVVWKDETGNNPVSPIRLLISDCHIVVMVYIITGGPGFGKTTILDLLALKGYTVGHEAARGLLAQLASHNVGNTIQFPSDFESLIASKRLAFLDSVDSAEVAFSDRGLPDQIAYSFYKKKIPSSYILELVQKNRYEATVFVTPPWEKIFVQDDVRNESFEESCQIHENILQAYTAHGYKLVNLPYVDADDRVSYILNFLGI